MTCYRTDLGVEYRYLNGTWGVSGIATRAEAYLGTDNTKYMTPLRTYDAIKKLVPLKVSTYGKAVVVKNENEGFSFVSSNKIPFSVLFFLTYSSNNS